MKQAGRYDFDAKVVAKKNPCGPNHMAEEWTTAGAEAAVGKVLGKAAGLIEQTRFLCAVTPALGQAQQARSGLYQFSR